MAEPYPSALGDLGLPADPRGGGPAEPAGEQGGPWPSRPYAASAEAPAGSGGMAGEWRPSGGPAGADEYRGGFGSARDDADRPDGPAFPARPGYGEPAGAQAPSEGTVAGYRLPGTPGAGAAEAPLNTAEGTGGYPGFGSSARSRPDTGAPGGGADAEGPAQAAGASAAQRGPDQQSAGGESGPDTEPFPAGGDPEAAEPTRRDTPGPADPASGREPGGERFAAPDTPAPWDDGGRRGGAGGPGRPDTAGATFGYGYAAAGSGDQPYAGVGGSAPGAWEPGGAEAWQESAQPWSAGSTPEGAERESGGATPEPGARDHAAGAPRAAEPASGWVGADRRDPRGSSEEPRWEPGGDTPAHSDQRPPAHQPAPGEEPERYPSGAGYRLDPEPGPLPRWEPRAGDPLDDPRSEGPGAGPAREGQAGSDGYDDELSRPYSHRIQTEEGEAAQPARSWEEPPSRGRSGDPLAEPSSASAERGFDQGAETSGRPEHGAGDELGGGLGTGSGNTWAFSRDDTRLPESVREAAAEAERKRRDGSPEHTTAFLHAKDDDADAARPHSGFGEEPSSAAPVTDLGGDPLAVIAAQQARARREEEAGAQAPGGERPESGSEPGGSVGAGTQEMPAVSDELGPDLRRGGPSYAGDELGPDLRAGDPAPSGEDPAPGDRYGHRDPYGEPGRYDPRSGRYGEPGPYGDGGEPGAYGDGGRSGEYADPGAYGETDAYGRGGGYRAHGEYGEYGGGPAWAQGADHGAGTGGGPAYYGPSGQAGGAYAAPGETGYAPAGPESHDTASGIPPEYTDRRGGQAPRPEGYAGEHGSPYGGPASADHRGPGHADSEGPATAAMDFGESDGPLGYGSRAGEPAPGGYAPEGYGPAHHQGGPEGYGGQYSGEADRYQGGYEGHAGEEDPRGRRGRSARDPIREDFPGFDRPPGGAAGDPYPGYDNIDHWPDTAPEASATLWLGIAALLPVLGLIAAIAALVMGPRARRAIRRSQGELEGLNLVKLGTILAWAGIGLFVLQFAGFVGLVVLS
ncbi:hypothetical protein FZ103_14805 [Streptomonospora sp. PA3]|nr:hypothetical protein [Streptomonospora sp. PA3]